MGHWRTHDGQEADLVIEHRDGSVLAFEVKAGARIDRRDARGLRALRGALGDAFTAGFVLHTGRLAYHLDDRIIAAPIDTLWTAPHGATGAPPKPPPVARLDEVLAELDEARRDR